jgi:hypothetical protein
VALELQIAVPSAGGAVDPLEFLVGDGDVVEDCLHVAGLGEQVVVHLVEEGGDADVASTVLRGAARESDAGVGSEPERVSAVGHDRLTGDPGGLVRGEQEDAPGNVGGLGLAVDHLAAQAGIHDGLGDPFGHRGPGK